MPLNQLANIAEISAAALLVVLLIYVGLQVRQNTAATQVAAGQAYADAASNVIGLINSSPNPADILHRGTNGLSNLKDGEMIQFGAYLDQAFISLEIFYFQPKAVLLDARLWSIYSNAIAGFMVQTGQGQWREMRHNWYDKEFQKYVNQVIDLGAAKPMHPFSVEPSKAT